jgi:hypothetical protein
LALAISAAVPADASEVTIPRAREKAAGFAENTCSHDKACVEQGVLNCRRQSAHLAFCRIFIGRRTEVQGRYTCDRLIRLAMDHETHRVRVTGLGRWNC